MKITTRQLRRIIREAITGPEPQALYDRMLELRDQYGSHFQYLRRLGDKYNELIDLRNEMYNQDNSYDNYGVFLSKVRIKPFSIFPSSAYKLWFDGVPTFEEVSSAIGEYEDLKGQFKEVNASDEADARYGRKRRNVVHEPSGIVVSSSLNRKGSLGT